MDNIGNTLANRQLATIAVIVFILWWFFSKPIEKFTVPQQVSSYTFPVDLIERRRQFSKIRQTQQLDLKSPQPADPTNLVSSFDSLVSHLKLINELLVLSPDTDGELERVIETAQTSIDFWVHSLADLTLLPQSKLFLLPIVPFTLCLLDSLKSKVDAQKLKAAKDWCKICTMRLYRVTTEADTGYTNFALLTAILTKEFSFVEIALQRLQMVIGIFDEAIIQSLVYRDDVLMFEHFSTIFTDIVLAIYIASFNHWISLETNDIKRIGLFANTLLACQKRTVVHDSLTLQSPHYIANKFYSWVHLFDQLFPKGTVLPENELLYENLKQHIQNPDPNLSYGTMTLFFVNLDKSPPKQSTGPTVQSVTITSNSPITVQTIQTIPPTSNSLTYWNKKDN